MSESTTPLSTAIKRKLEKEDAESIEKEVNQTELVSAVPKKKSKFQGEKISIQIEINENQTTVLDNKLKTNDEIDDQEQHEPEGKVSLNNVNNSAKISANEQEDTATNEITSIEKNLPITEIVTETRALPNIESEECRPTPIIEKVPTVEVNEAATKDVMENAKFNIISDEANKLMQNYIEKNVLAESNLTSSHPKTKCYKPTQKVYDVPKEPKDSKPLEDILPHDEAKKLTTQIKPTRILFPSSLSVTVKQYTDTDGIKKSVLPKRVIQPSITIVPIENKTKDGKGNSEIDNGDEDCIASITGGEANNACNLKIIPINSNAISTMRIPKQSNSSIYPTGLITKRMVVKNISDGTLATTKKSIVSTLQCTSTTSRKIIAINRNKLMPINYKVQNSVFLPTPQSKANKSAHDKPIITSIEYIPKDPFLSIGSTAKKSINSKSLNDEKANGNNINDCGLEDLIITGDSISTSSTHKLPTAPKLKKFQLSGSANIPTLTPAYLKALSAYIKEAKNAHKASKVLKDSSVAESSTSKDVSAETNPLVTKKSICKDSSDLALENENSKDESIETNTDADEEWDLEKIWQAESTKSITNSGEQLDTGSVAVEKAANRDSLENHDVQCNTVEMEKRERSQVLLTNHEEAKARNGKDTEKYKNDANHDESEQPNEKETLQINSLESKATKYTAECAEKMDVTESNDIQFATDIPEQLDNTVEEENQSSEEDIPQKIVAECEIPKIEANATAKMHDEQCEIVEEKKKDRIDFDKGKSEGVEKQAMNQNKSTHCGTDESEKMEMDESIGSIDELKLAAESETTHVAVEVGEVVEKRKLDFFGDDQPEDAEVESQIVNQNSSSTNKGELKLDCENVTAQSEANKECKLVENKTNLFDCDEEPKEGVDIEKQSLDQNKATECGIEECAKTDVDENGDKQTEVDNFEDHTVVTDANGTGNNESIVPSENESTNDSCIISSSKEKNINLDTSKGTKHVADVTDKISIVQSSSTHKVYENENKSSSESYANQCEHEYNKLDLNKGKNAESERDDNDESVPSQHETDGIQTIPDIETALNKNFNVFSTCVNSDKCNVLTQTNDSTIMLLKNISIMRRKVRRQAEEIVSLNAAMKLLDTASLLKTFDNY